jgi:DNA-binding CsgD family transcriptional regulator
MRGEHLTEFERIARLSPRERETLLHIARGLSTKQMARLMGIAYNTVASNTRTIFNKLGVSKRAQAAVMAAKCGLV